MDGFLLATPDYVLRADTVDGQRFADPAAAVAALRGGGAELIVGALPFVPAAPAALAAPSSAGFGSVAAPSPLPALPSVRLLRQLPEPDEHVARVAALVDRIGCGPLGKVVAARSVLVQAETPIDPELLVTHLVARHPTANGYAVDIAASGRAGTLVGSSPEMLVSVRGGTVRLRPLAGTAPRGGDPIADQHNAEKLLTSMKDRKEHAFVIDWITERLGPVCAELSVPDGPELISTPDVWHLATPITGRLADPTTTTALDLALSLHPTPAVCGTPTDLALAVIAETEEDRGFYSGAVGWCDASGDGDWIVAIRCAELAADGLTARAYAGGGIVVGSDPRAELEETTVKLRTLLSPLGLRL